MIPFINAFLNNFHKMITENQTATAELGKLNVLVGVKEFPGRVKCATLAWHTLHAALINKDDRSISTE